jgi:hypothetical protein
MAKTLLSLVLLLKNEATSVQDMIRHAAPAVNQVDLLDTGSTDDTIDLARETCLEYGLPLRVLEKPFVDYGSSRNDALAFAESGDSFFALQLSGDETLHGAEALRTFCKVHLNQNGIGQNVFSVWWECGETLMHSTRIVRLGTPWRWTGATHEYLECPGDHVGATIPLDDARIVRKESDPARKVRQWYRDLELLHTQYKQDSFEPRRVFYLAQTMEDLGFYAEAARFYLERSVIETGWAEEQFVAKYRSGICTLRAGLPESSAEQVLWDAIAMRPTRAEPMVSLGELMVSQQRFRVAYLLAERAMKLPFPLSDGLALDRSAYGHRLDRLISNTAAYAHAYDVGEQATRRLVDRYPDEAGFQRNLDRYQRMRISAAL